MNPKVYTLIFDGANIDEDISAFTTTEAIREGEKLAKRFACNLVAISKNNVIIYTEKDKEMEAEERKYKLIKGFSLNDLYQMGCPVEIFTDVLNVWDGDIKKTFNVKSSIRNIKNLDVVKMHKDWFISKGYIEEIIEDIELKPGMILENVVGTILFVDKDNRLRQTTGDICSHRFKTLNELNNESVYTWEVKE